MTRQPFDNGWTERLGGGVPEGSHGWYRSSALAATLEADHRAERRRMLTVVAVTLGLIGGSLLLLLGAS